MYRTIASLCVVLACAGHSPADQEYLISGFTLPSADGSFGIMEVSGAAVGSDLAESLVGSLTVEGAAEPWLFATTFAGESSPVPAFGLPAEHNAIDPTATGPGLSGATIGGIGWRFIDFELVPGFSYEDIGAWELATVTLGTLIGGEGERMTAAVSFYPVPNPSTLVLMGLGSLAFVGCALAQTKR